MTQIVLLDGETLSVEDVVRVARGHPRTVRVAISNGARRRVQSCRRVVDEFGEEGRVVYGFTTGFGPLSSEILAPEESETLSRYIAKSHAAGVGKYADNEIVRAMMVLRANTLAKGLSGITLETLDKLVAMINRGVHPRIPEEGSVGASGDLAPLAHMTLAMIGEGTVEYKGKEKPAREGMRAVGGTARLKSKEGLALTNGSQFSSAFAALGIYDAENLIKCSEIALAMSLEALAGVSDPFSVAIQRARRHPGQESTAANIRTLTKGSNIVKEGRFRRKEMEARSKHLDRMLSSIGIHKTEHDYYRYKDSLGSFVIQIANAIGDLTDTEKPGLGTLFARLKKTDSLSPEWDSLRQLLLALESSSDRTAKLRDAAGKKSKFHDPYSLRCAPQVIGIARDCVRYVKEILRIEINSATDNPLIFPASRISMSGGNFHGQPISWAMDSLSIALSSVGNISERRIDKLTDASNSNGLPAFLVPRNAKLGLNSGFMIVQYTAAALVSQNKILAHPASVDSIPTAAGFEDFVSMSPIAGIKLRKIIENVERIAAIEMICAAQGIDLRTRDGWLSPSQKISGKVGRGVRAAYDMLRNEIGVKAIVEDEEMELHSDIERVRNYIHNGELVRHVERTIGKLRRIEGK